VDFRRGGLRGPPPRLETVEKAQAR